MVVSLLFQIFVFFISLLPIDALCEAIQGIRELEAEKVAYNHNNMHLEGRVHILHSFAELFCQKAVLEFPKSAEKNQSCEKIFLHGDVKVLLSDGSKLTSQDCEIDCKTMEGIFSSEPPEKVIYVAKPESNLEDSAMQAKSKSMRIKVRKKENSSEYEISDLQGEDTVSIEYGTDISCNSDRLTIHHMTNEKYTEDPYVAFLFPESENGYCYLYDKEKNVIAAKQMRVFPTTQKVICDFAQGTCVLENEFSLQNVLSFSSKILTWDYPKKSIKLEKQVQVDVKNQAKITGNDSLELFLTGMSLKKIHAICSQSKTRIVFRDPVKNQSFDLVCFGTSHIDCDNNRAKFISPKGPDGTIADENQIFFQNGFGFFYSDVLELEDVSLIPKTQKAKNLEKIAISGNVKMCNSTLELLNENKDVQIVLSDNVDIFPNKHEAIFFSHNMSPVLFYDSAKKAVVSAEKINFFRHMNQDTIKTEGKVRCFFDQNEQERIHALLKKPEEQAI